MKKKINYGKIKAGLNNAVHFAGWISKDVLYILVTATCNRASRDILNNFTYHGELDYGDAVKAISESDMFSHDKRKSISLIKVGECPAYYKAIAVIAMDSSMFSHDKYRAIENIA